MRGRCHCGAVTLTLAQRPDRLNDCNCSLCGTRGAIWGYLPVSSVTIDGDTEAYLRTDREKPAVCVHFCGRCGCTTHWSPMPHIPQDRMGVNVHLFDRRDLAGLTLNFPDGANWDGQSAYGMRKPAEIY